MSFKQLNSETYIADAGIVTAGPEELSFLKQKLKTAQRGRVRLCAHLATEDLVHEMIIALSRGSYIRPHKHLNKTESFHIIEGLADVVVFNDTGDLTELLALGDCASGRAIFYRMSLPLFHTLLIRSDVLILHETTNGPFCPGDAEFAAWAPAPEDEQAARDYMRELDCRVQTMGKLSAE
jgi:cupin fold WbuC family metalloprotein